MKKFAVIGNPVNHSLSPVIHDLFARQFDVCLEYLKIQAQEGEFLQSVTQFVKQGGHGLNVTVPYKADACALSDQLSHRAELANAVNTLSFRENLVYGDNTDGEGLIEDLERNHTISLFSKRILILGAGGAVSGVIGPLLEKKPALITIANRTVKKAKDLQKKFSQLGPIAACGLAEIDPVGNDIVINATAASLANQVPDVDASVLQHTQLAYDMMYSPDPTVFMQWAASKGVDRVTDGLGMLVEQAAAAFFIWHNKHPETKSVLKYIQSQYVQS